MKIYKDDYKRYRECGKKAWMLNRHHFKKAQEWIANQKITCFFDFKASSSNSTIDWDRFDPEIQTDYEGETIRDGHEVGQFAKLYFQSKHACLDLTNIYGRQLDPLTVTTKALKNSKIEVLFEPYFEANDCIVRCDILKRAQNGWEIIEVKAVTKPKKEHFLDLLYQYAVLTAAGINVVRLSLMYLNNKYVRDEEIDLEQLFIINDQFQKSPKAPISNLIDAVKSNLEERNFWIDIKNLKILLELDNDKSALAFLRGQHCCLNELQPAKSVYCSHVFANLPEKNTIFNLYKMRSDKKALLYHGYHLLDISSPKLLEHKLTPLQLRQIAVVKKEKDIIDESKIEQLKKIMIDYKCPIYMYDFETTKAAVPKWKGAKPYQQIPFQYSLDVILDLDFNSETKAHIAHYEFLADGESDPRIPLTKRLLHDFKQHGFGIYVAYNKSFECNILAALSKFLPDEAPVILKYAHHTIDLMDFFKNFLIYHPDFNGSLSIKKTLPAFAPNFTYKNLAIQKGDMAAEIFRQRVEQKITLKEWETYVAPELLRYCGQDTMAMVILFEKIYHLLKERGIVNE